jgi:hypothetical protein
MYFDIKFEPLAILKLVVDILMTTTDTFTAVDFRQSYAVTGLRVGNQEILSYSEKISHEAGLTFCKGLRYDIYTVYQDHNVEEIMAHFSVEDVWTGIKINKAANKMTDLEGYAPVTQTNTQAIDRTSLVIEEIPTTHHVYLQKTETGTFQYKSSLSTENRSVLCVKQLDFPKREQDLQAMESYRTSMKQLLSNKKAILNAKKTKLNSVLSTLPVFDKSLAYASEGTIDLQAGTLQEIMTITAQLNTISSKFKNLQSVADFSTTTLTLIDQLEKIDTIVSNLFEPFIQPKLIFETLLQPTIQTTDSVPFPFVLTKKDKDIFVLKVGRDDTVPDGIVEKIKSMMASDNFYKISLADIALLIVGSLGIVSMIISISCSYCREPRTFNRVYKITNPIVETKSPLHKSCSRPTNRVVLPTNMVRKKPSGKRQRVTFKNSRVDLPMWMGSSDLDD